MKGDVTVCTVCVVGVSCVCCVHTLLSVNLWRVAGGDLPGGHVSSNVIGEPIAVTGLNVCELFL